jgi:hypothetical protein
MDTNTYGFQHKWSNISAAVFMAHLVIYLFLLNSCKSYTHPDGSKERAIRLVGDKYEDLNIQEYSVLKAFDMDNFQQFNDFSTGEGFIVEEVDLDDVRAMVDHAGRALVLMWYPNCGALLPSLHELIQETQGCENMPLILVSMSYELDGLYLSQETIKYRKRTYVLNRTYGETRLAKHYNMLNELCPDCFERYGRKEYGDIWGFVMDADGSMPFIYKLNWNKKKKTNEIENPEELITMICE